MLSSLKSSISKTVQSITEKLSSSFSREENKGEEKYRHRPSLKRSRTGQMSANEALRPDMLVTPPEKRLKFHEVEIGRLATKRASNDFFWKYVVEGKATTSVGEKESLEGRIDSKKKEIAGKAKIETDVLVSSSFPFKKIAEPRVQCHQNPTDAISKRKPLHSQLSYNTQPAVWKQSFPSEVVKPITRDKGAMAARCVFEVYENDKSTKPSWTPIRKATTADTVVRLEERDRYRKLLAQYTRTPYLDNTDIDSSIHTNYDVRVNCSTNPNNDFDCTLTEKSGSKSILPTVKYHNFPRLERADSILGRFSSIITEGASPNALLSSTAVSSDAKLFKEASLVIDRQGHAEASLDRTTKEHQRVFSGMDTRNISRSERKMDPQSWDPLGDTWTLKWRKILQEDELDRQKQIKREEMKLKSYENKRKEREAELLKKIEARKGLNKKTEEAIHVPLTEEMCRLVSNAWRPGNPQECLAQAFNVAITRHDLASLADMNWLNDEVVNFYFHLLQERSIGKGNLKMHFFNSFFYPKLLKTGYSGVRRWTKKVDIFSVDIVVLPVHLGMHWCLAAIDMRKKQIAYYDSLKGNNNQCLAALRNYINEEHKDKKKTPLDINEWSQLLAKNIPEQKNGCDCGVFTCKYAECLTRDSPFNFTQTDMPYFRERMVYEILTKKLL